MPKWDKEEAAQVPAQIWNIRRCEAEPGTRCPRSAVANQPFPLLVLLRELRHERQRSGLQLVGVSDLTICSALSCSSKREAHCTF
jgi:hypothetical protein